MLSTGNPQHIMGMRDETERVLSFLREIAAIKRKALLMREARQQRQAVDKPRSHEPQPKENE